MKRRLFTLTAFLSLLLCAATLVLWVRSYNTFDDLNRIRTSHNPDDYTQHYIRLGSNNGRFLFTWRDIIWPSTNPSYEAWASTGDRDIGVHLTHKQPFDFDQYWPITMSNDRSWDVMLGGIRYRQLIQDAGGAALCDPRFWYPNRPE